MESLPPGTIITTTSGFPATILRHIGSGGQGEVYEVDYLGEHRALKWYFPRSIRQPKRFYDNLNKNVSRGAPDNSFLWPIAVTDEVAFREHGSFGYIMDLRQCGYEELSSFILGTARFKSFEVAIEACKNMAMAFAKLHNIGYCYQDMNDGNFFINPDTGEVLICDNDNAAPNHTDTFIMGTPRYMAPEIVRGESGPDSWTDRYSLAVVIFIILCMGHPLEGKRWTVPCLTPDLEKRLYGTEPLFVFDPGKNGNRPVRGVHAYVLRRWPYLPDYVQQAFQTSFSTATLTDMSRRQERLREADWLDVLVRFQSEIATCPQCGNEVFVKNAADTPCDMCGTFVRVTNRLSLRNYDIAALPGARVHRCQLAKGNADHALDVALEVREGRRGGERVLALYNATQETLQATTSQGQERHVAAGDIVPLKPGVSLTVYGGRVMIQ